MAEYDSARALAKRLIAKKGRSGVKLLRSDPGTVTDANRPWKAEGGAAADVLIATFPAVFLSPIEARSSAGQFAMPVFLRSDMDLSDSLTPETSHMVYLADSALPVGVELDGQAVGMLLESRSVRYVVLRCQTLRAGDQAILHILSVKG